MDKPTIRTKLAARRREMAAEETAEERIARGTRFAESCLRTAEIQAACERGALIASYESLPSEPPTTQLNEALVTAGAKVVVPVHEINGRPLDGLEWLDIANRKVVAATPAVLLDLPLEVVVTPALAVGRDGSRLGKGKGYYDRFFAQLPRNPVGPMRIALVSEDEVFESMPVDELDEPIDFFVTG